MSELPPISGLPEIGNDQCPSRLKPTWGVRGARPSSRGHLILRDARPSAALLRMRGIEGRRAPHDEEEHALMSFRALAPTNALILRSRAQRGVSKDGPHGERPAP